MTLAACAATILAREHRYETAPELMRYALLDDGTSDAAEALESMRLPEAALAILRREATLHAIVFGTPELPNSKIDAKNERRLTKLLGKDAGDEWGAWAKLYDSRDWASTPLTPTQAAEVDRVAKAITAYWSAAAELKRASQPPVSLPDFDASGTAALENEVRKYCETAKAMLIR